MEKWLRVVLFLLSSCELVYGQCFLSIGLTQFENLYSLEIRPNSGGNDRFCCCDADTNTCKNDANKFTSGTCESLCDTYFVLSFSDCQNLPSCSVTDTTDISVDSAATTSVNYDFYFIVGSSAVEQVAFEIEMWDSDGSASREEIDMFDITATFPSDNQEQVFTGNRGIATITLTYDLICIEPNASTTAVASSEVIGTCAVTDTTTSTVTSTAITTSTSTEVETSTQIATSTSTTFTTSTSTEVDTSTQIGTSTSTAITTSTEVETSTEIITSTSTATTTTTSTEVDTSTEVIDITSTSTTTATSTEVETSTEIIISTSTATATTTSTEVDTSTEVITFTSTATATATSTEVETSTETAIATSTSTEVHSVTSTAIINSTSTAIATSTEVETSTEIITSISTATATATSTEVDTSTETITSTSTAIATSTSTEVETSTEISTSTATATSTSTEVQSVTSTAIINSTSTTITTSTSTEVQLVTTTATMSTVVTISATPRAITVTRTVSANSLPGDPSVGEQSAGPSDSTSIIWMSLFILFTLLTIVAVMISIYLACRLKKKNKFKFDSNAGDVTLAQTNPLAPINNPVYGSQGINGDNSVEEVREVYSTLANDLYIDGSESSVHIYSTCGPAESPTNEQYEYVRTKPINASAAATYDVPTTLATSK